MKVSKASVRYRPADLPDVRCGTCVMFHPDGTCDLVAGSIDAGHVCDRWEPRHPVPSGHSRENAATAAALAVVAIWLAAEAAILAAIAHWVMKAVTGGILAILGLRRLRQAVTLIIHQAQAETRAVLASLSSAVRADAERVIRADLAALPAGGAPPSTSSLERLHPPGIPLTVLERAVAEAMGGPAAPEWRSLPSLLHQAGMNVLRASDDTYRAVIAQATGAFPGDRVEAAQKALDEFAARGVTGFTDSLRRRWDIAAYVEMATRTAASRLHLMLQLRAAAAAGLDLVLIVHSGATPPCPKCAPWVGRILSISGMTPTGSDVDGEEVAGSIADATGTGLLHPQCRCSAVPFTDGTEIPPLPPAPARDYEAEQAQRRHERAVRRETRRRAVAATPQARKTASVRLAHVRAHQFRPPG